MAEDIKAVVIGLGPMGVRHARAWQAVVGDDAVGALIRHHRDRQRLQAAGLVGVREVSSEAAWPQSVQWASICAPTPVHAEIALPLLRDGVHVVVEKPLTNHIDDARALAQTGPGRCFVAHTCRAEATTLATLAAVADNTISTVCAQRDEELRPLPPNTPLQARHGRLLDVLVHDISAVLDLLPSEPPDHVNATWDKAEQSLRCQWFWPKVTLRIAQLRAAANSRRNVRLDGDDQSWCWLLQPGERRAWSETSTTRTEIACGWHDAVTTIVAEAVDAQQRGRASYIDAAFGVRAMQLSAMALATLDDTVFGQPFSWDWVR